MEAIGQSTFDTVDEKGAAYSVSYVTTDVVAGVLLDKGLGKLGALGKADDVAGAAGDVAKYTDEVAEAANKAGKHADDVAEATKAAAGKVVRESGINSYDEFSKAVSEIGKKTDLTDAPKISEL